MLIRTITTVKVNKSETNISWNLNLDNLNLDNFNFQFYAGSAV